MQSTPYNISRRWGSTCHLLSGTPLRRLLQRIGHVTVSCCDQRLVLVWGGYHSGLAVDDHQPTSDNSEAVSTLSYHDPRQLLVYDIDAELWWLLSTSGGSCVPSPRCGATAVYLDNSLYIFGGFGDGEFGVSATLFRLCLTSLQWKIVSKTATGVPPLPCDKLVSWTYNGRLYVYGGFGPRPPSSALGRKSYGSMEFCAEGSDDGGGRGWLDQLVSYDPDSNQWHWPQTRGRGPGPRAAHAAARIGNVVYVYGGRCRQRLGDFYCLRLDSPVMEWRPLPADRPSSWHSLTPLGQHALLLYGGISEHACILSEPRIFCLRRQQWLPFRGVCQSYAPSSNPSDTSSSSSPIVPIVSMSSPLGELPPRMWHTAVAVSSLDECAEVLVVGGLRNSIFDRVQQCADNWLSVRFRPRSLRSLCVEAIVSCTQRSQPMLTSMMTSELPANLMQQLMLRFGIGDS